MDAQLTSGLALVRASQVCLAQQPVYHLGEAQSKAKHLLWALDKVVNHCTCCLLQISPASATGLVVQVQTCDLAVGTAQDDCSCCDRCAASSKRLHTHILDCHSLLRQFGMCQLLSPHLPRTASPRSSPEIHSHCKWSLMQMFGKKAASTHC